MQGHGGPAFPLKRKHISHLRCDTPVVHTVTYTAQPIPTLDKSTEIHLISSSATFLDTACGMAVRSLSQNDSVVYLSKDECHLAQNQNG